MARAMEVVGDRWSILILREAYYGVKRFDEFEYYIGIAPNILSTRLKKFIDAGVMTRVPLPEHAGRGGQAHPGAGPPALAEALAAIDGLGKPDQVRRVLHEVGESFLNFQVVAKREAEERSELASRADVVAAVPYADQDICDLAGLLRLGDVLWREP